jgi:hypothetical protein
MNALVYVESALRGAFRSDFVTSLVLLITVVFSAYLAPPIPGSLIMVMSFPLTKFILFTLFLFALKMSLMTSLIISVLFLLVDLVLNTYSKYVDQGIDTVVKDIGIAESAVENWGDKAVGTVENWGDKAVDSTVNWGKEAEQTVKGWSQDTADFLDGQNVPGYN